VDAFLEMVEEGVVPAGSEGGAAFAPLLSAESEEGRAA
jgi:hypothetical protein